MTFRPESQRTLHLFPPELARLASTIETKEANQMLSEEKHPRWPHRWHKFQLSLISTPTKLARNVTVELQRQSTFCYTSNRSRKVDMLIRLVCQLCDSPRLGSALQLRFRLVVFLSLSVAIVGVQKSFHSAPRPHAEQPSLGGSTGNSLGAAEKCCELLGSHPVSSLHTRLWTLDSPRSSPLASRFSVLSGRGR